MTTCAGEEADLLALEGVPLTDPREGQETHEFFRPLDWLQHERLVGNEPSQGVVEAMVGLTIGCVDRALGPLQALDDIVLHRHGRLGYGRAEIRRDMIAGHEAELLASARDTPHPAHVGPEGPGDLASGLSHRLGEVGGRGEYLHHGQERLRLPEPVGDLLIKPRLVQRRRGLGGERRGKLNLMW